MNPLYECLHKDASDKDIFENGTGDSMAYEEVLDYCTGFIHETRVEYIRSATACGMSYMVQVAFESLTVVSVGMALLGGLPVAYKFAVLVGVQNGTSQLVVDDSATRLKAAL